jgi:tetratricopeptide (TPR) repeat protein
LPGLVVGILLGLALWAFIKRKPVGFVGLAFFVLIAPNSSVFPIADFAFEHRMYLPLTCLVTLAVTVTHWFSEKMFSGSIISVHSRNRVYSLIGGIAVLLCVVLTAQRNKDYLSEEAMWRDIVRKRPDNLRARNDLAVALSERGRTEEALKQYGEVLSRIPADIRNRLEAGQIRVSGVFVNNSFEYNYFVAHANLGLMMFRELHDNAGAVRHYLSALAVAPSHAGVREKLKMVLRHSGIPEEKLDTELTKLLEQKTGHK